MPTTRSKARQEQEEQDGTSLGSSDPPCTADDCGKAGFQPCAWEALHGQRCRVHVQHDELVARLRKSKGKAEAAARAKPKAASAASAADRGRSRRRKPRARLGGDAAKERGSTQQSGVSLQKQRVRRRPPSGDKRRQGGARPEDPEEPDELPRDVPPAEPDEGSCLLLARKCGTKEALRSRMVTGLICA